VRRFFVAIVVFGLVAGLSAPATYALDQPGGAAAVASARAFITADMTLPDDPSGTIPGEFQARGAAVHRGLLCPSGTVLGARNGDGGPLFDFTVAYTFTCDDGSGTFGIDLSVRLFKPRRTFFIWSVTDGTGDYTGLLGGGFGIGRPSPLGSDVVRDWYMGRIGRIGS